MNEYFIHLGLHKTATKYFQHFYFPNFPEDKVLYNPYPLQQYMMDYVKAEEADRPSVLEAFNKEKENLAKTHPDKKIVISREIMAGNLFNAYREWQLSTQLVKDLFPEAKIFLSLRYQIEWLISCYRESIHEHHYQPISDFLNYDKKSGKFLIPESDVNSDGFANLYALNLDFTKMIDRLYGLFGKENVFVFFYEDFKKDKNAILRKVEQIIDLPEIKPKASQGIPNRGYSRLAINLSIMRSKLLKSVGLKGFVHRPIFFYGKNSIPAGAQHISILDQDKYWGEYFLRDNEELRSKNYPDLSSGEKIRREFTWRYFIKNRFDKVLYKDGDLLGELRSKLEDEYKVINKDLVKIFDENNIPQKYK